MTPSQTSHALAKTALIACFLSALLVVPFRLMEWINRRALMEAFPVPLFGYMAVHTLVIGGLLAPLLMHLWSSRSVASLKVEHWVALGFAVFLLWGYTHLLLDQFPCFLGVPHCD